MFRIVTFLTLFFLLHVKGYSHSVQVLYCQNCDGKLRLYVEHWHGTENPSTTTMTISVTVNGNTTTSTGSPVDNIQDVDIADLPGCSTPPQMFAACGQANQYRDWVYYDFPDVPTGVPIEITVLSGNNLFTQDCDGNMYPASTGVFTLDPTLKQGSFSIPEQTLCRGEAFDIQPQMDSLGGSPADLKWTNDNPSIGLADSGTGFVPAFTAIGSANQQIANITLTSGCKSGNTRIIINPIPVANFTQGNFNANANGDPLSGRLCLYDSVPFSSSTNTSSGTLTNFTWDFGNGTTLSNVQNPKVKYAVAGTYDVQLVAENSFGCTDTAIIPVTVNPIPEANLIVDPECLNRAVQFRDQSTVPSPDFIDRTFLTFGDGSPEDNTLNPTHLYTAAGTYNLFYHVVTNNGCRDTTSAEVTVFDIPNADFTFTQVCENEEPTAFFDNSSVATGSVVEWNWNFKDNNNTLSFSDNPTHKYSRPGVYNVSLVVMSDNGCTDTIVKPVTVLPKPTTIFLSNITEDCGEACIEFYDYTIPNSPNITNWFWDLGDGTQSTSQAPSHCYTNESNTNDASFDVQLITINSLGCSDTLTEASYINVWHNPLAVFTVIPGRTNMYDTEVATDNNSIGANYYSWSFNNAYFDTDFEPSHTYVQDSARYLIQLAVETDHGCYDTASYLLVIDPVVTIFVPNAFTPDGDGNNDEFMFKEFGVIEELLEFVILDRWGNIVHQTDKFLPWDGNHKGKPAVQDTYVYRISYKDVLGERGELRGHVNLLR